MTYLLWSYITSVKKNNKCRLCDLIKEMSALFCGDKIWSHTPTEEMCVGWTLCCNLHYTYQFKINKTCTNTSVIVLKLESFFYNTACGERQCNGNVFCRTAVVQCNQWLIILLINFSISLVCKMSENSVIVNLYLFCQFKT